ncbi:MAG: Fic family protein [Spirochaetaceae bacterium]|jgi:Fic family protein|nr:Fic family protein [Spirochaetaceae bacterium]
MKNTYEHITFALAWEKNEAIANLLGQCYAYIQAIVKTPIRPDYWQELLSLALNKGAQATTAIEGNTLSDDEIRAIQGGKKLPPSKGYLQKEVENILAAFNTIKDELIKDHIYPLISPDLIKRFHAMVGKDIGEAFNASPGCFRRNNVTVGQYRPPSFERVEGLVKKLCAWLEQQFHYSAGQNFDETVIQAIVTHIYIAWIHPFGDSNGRTARLLEFYLLLRAGVPIIASHILSNHYNETRNEYYRQLQQTVETRDLTPFINYALVGFRDGLEGVLGIIHDSQIEMTWRNYVHDRIGESGEEQNKSEKILRRIRQLAYYIPSDKYYSLSEIRIIHPNIIREYKQLSGLTLSRDIALIQKLDLIVEQKRKYRTNKEILKTFIAPATTDIRRSH